MSNFQSDLEKYAREVRYIFSDESSYLEINKIDLRHEVEKNYGKGSLSFEEVVEFMKSYDSQIQNKKYYNSSDLKESFYVLFDEQSTREEAGLISLVFQYFDKWIALYYCFRYVTEPISEELSDFSKELVKLAKTKQYVLDEETAFQFFKNGPTTKTNLALLSNDSQKKLSYEEIVKFMTQNFDSSKRLGPNENSIFFVSSLKPKEEQISLIFRYPENEFTIMYEGSKY